MIYFITRHCSASGKNGGYGNGEMPFLSSVMVMIKTGYLLKELNRILKKEDIVSGLIQMKLRRETIGEKTF